jgi:hypothetical protein
MLLSIARPLYEPIGTAYRLLIIAPLNMVCIAIHPSMPLVFASPSGAVLVDVVAGS